MTPLPAHLLALLLAQAVAAPAPAPPTYGVATGSGAREFEAEGARKDQMRRYRETGSMKDYPGVRCAVFHRC